MPLLGERPDRATYVDLREISDGSNQLIRCSHRVLGADCVQKTVPIVQGGSAFAEPRLLEELDHPHIPPVREAQFDPDRHNCITFVMPWYAGGSVARALVEGHSFSVQDALSVVRDVLDALEYLHTVKGHLHRDIKTSNVLLADDRRTGFLTDLERAAPMEDDGAARAVLATVFYMAPECAATGRHSVRSDVYGAGMVLFEMLNGRFEWEGLDPAVAERRILNGKRAFVDRLVAPSAFAPQIPDVLVRITRKALSRDPAARYESARELLTALNRVRVIDWYRVADDGLRGEWIGTWPPGLRREQRNRIRVTARILVSGKYRGQRRWIAEVQRPASASWRRFGVPDATIAPSDTDAARQFFRDVAARAPHLRPARWISSTS